MTAANAAPSPDARRITDWLSARQAEMTAFLGTLVNIDSPSDSKADTDRYSDFLSKAFATDGLHIITYPQEKVGTHFRATWHEELAPANQQILVILHMDTVFPVGEVARRPFRVEGDRAYGPGVCDMKHGHVQTLYAIRALQALGLAPKRQITVVASTDEETGSLTSRGLIEEEAKRSAAVFVMEPSVWPGSIKTSRKGTGRFSVRVKGRAAHAGANPEEGISATDELARLILAMHAYNNPVTGTTVNVGAIGGGTRANVVAAEAWGDVDFRAVTVAEADRVVPAILGLKAHNPEAIVEITGGLNRPPMERTPAIVALYQHARSLANEIGFDMGEASTGGGSDGNFTAALGIPTLDGLGAVGGGSHGVSEFVLLRGLLERTALLARLMQTV